MADLRININGKVEKPKVGNNSIKLNQQIITFDSNSFTKDWSDPQNGQPNLVTITGLPTILNLEYNSADAALGTSFDPVNSGLLSFNLDPKYVIHNSHLYEFSKDIDLIIADYNALGYELIANVSGLLTFINPTNLSDIVFVQGEGKDLQDLQITFKTRSSTSGIDSGEAVMSIIPWENVNLKENYILQTGGGGVSNPVTGLSVTGTDTKTITITLQDSTTISANFTDIDTVTNIVVTDANTNPERHRVAIVDGTDLYETVTALVTPVISGNILTLKYKNENNVTQQVQVDLSGIMPTNDINVDSATYDAATNIITLTETNGDVYTIDLSEFSISTSVNVDGSVDIIQEGVTKLTVSPVGVSNDYNDLNNLPSLDFDKYLSWKLKVNSDGGTDITSQDIVDLLQGTNTTITRVGNQVTFSSTDTNSFVNNAVWDETTGNLTINRTDGLPDIIVNLDNRYLKTIVVNATNINPTLHKIADIKGVDIKETVTNLVAPELNGNILTLKYVNENNIEQSVTVDLSNLVTVDVNVEDVSYDASQNILTLTESDGTVHQIDLSEFSIITNTLPDGSIEVNQEGVVKFTISKVGTTNNYYDLDNIPKDLPQGQKDQIYYINEDGTNNIIPDWMWKRGIIVQTQREYDVASTAGIQLSEVFKTWDLFSHYDDTTTEGSYSPPSFPAFGGIGPNDSDKLTSDEFYNGDTWSYDENTDSIILNQNFGPFTGFIAPREFANYTFESTMTSSDVDDDSLLMIIGFWTDPSTGYEHTLSVERTLQQQSGINDHQYLGEYSYRIVYNYGQTTQQTIIDGTNLAPCPNPGAAHGTAGWVNHGPTRVQIIRTGDSFEVRCSQFGSTTLDESTLLTLDLASYPQLEGFTVASRVGFGARSQPNATFSNIVFTGLIDYIFYDKGNTYETYEYDPNTQSYFLQNPQTIFANDYFGKNRFVYSYMFDKVYHIDEYDDIINVKGDEGVSWDANNALTIGSDNKPYLNNLLVGGNQNTILSFNPGYDSGLTYNTYATWKIDNAIYELSKTITLSPADATYDRIDVFVLNSAGDITIKEGTPAANPVKPEIDPSTELEASFVIIPANATAPEGIQVDKIYDENAGYGGGELVGTPTPSGNTRIVMNSSADPSTGTVSIEATSLLKYDAVEFVPQNPIDINTVSQINYSLKNKPGIYYTINKSGSGKNRTFEEVPMQTYRIMLQGDDSAGNFKSIYLDDDPNYSVYNDTSYQLLSAAISTSELVNIKYIRFICNAESNVEFGYFLDNIRFVGGVNQAPSGNWASVEYVNNQDAVILQDSKDYTNQEIALTETYADDGDAQTLSNANDYADGLVNVLFFADYTAMTAQTGVADKLYIDKSTGDGYIYELDWEKVFEGAKQPEYEKIISKSTNFTILSDDFDGVYRVTNTATVTVPFGLPIGYKVTIKRAGTGEVTLTGATNVVLEYPVDFTNQINQQYDAIEIVKEANDGTNDYIGIYGALKPV